MTPYQLSLYRYLVIWRDYKPADAMRIVEAMEARLAA